MSVKGLETGYIVIPPQTGAAELALALPYRCGKAEHGRKIPGTWLVFQLKPGLLFLLSPTESTGTPGFLVSFQKAVFVLIETYFSRATAISWKPCAVMLFLSHMTVLFESQITSKIRHEPREEIILSTKRNRSSQSVQAFEYRGVL